MSAYPEGFHAWPPEERNAYFADEARAYDGGKNRTVLRLASTNEPQPAAPIDQMPDGYDGGKKRQRDISNELVTEDQAVCAAL
jgi:hypothetical protein